MAIVHVEVTKIGVKFSPPIPIVHRLDPIEFQFTFWNNSEIARVELSEFFAFKQNTAGSSPSGAVSNNWNTYRGASTSATPANPKGDLKARTNVGSGNYFIKYKLTMVHKNGTRMNVDPILDERPGGSSTLLPKPRPSAPGKPKGTASSKHRRKRKPKRKK